MSFVRVERPEVRVTSPLGGKGQCAEGVRATRYRVIELRRPRCNRYSIILDRNDFIQRNRLRCRQRAPKLEQLFSRRITDSREPRGSAAGPLDSSRKTGFLGPVFSADNEE